MAQFSSSDINDAKRRVQQMHQRAQSVVSQQTQQQSTQNHQPQQPPKPHSYNQSQNQLNIFSQLKNFGITGSGNGSSGLILALILILSREKADNMLILALLYILL